MIAVEPSNGSIRKRVVLDSAEIAATKELVTLRTSADRTRLYIANGSDESATILSLPDLAVLREITMEGETIRDVIPDPRGRYVYLLGRRVHVFDGDGQVELRTLDVADPMAVAVSSDGSRLAVFTSEKYGDTTATAVAVFNADENFSELSRDPLQTQETVEGALFANGDRSLVAFSRSRLFEKVVLARPTRLTTTSGTLKAAIGDLVNSNHICLPEGSGAQAATLTASDDQLVYAERRCSVSGTFSGSRRGVTPVSLYGVSAYAIAYDEQSDTIVATDRSGFLTIYRVPRAVVAK